jgi:hypothetical protein
MLAFLKRLLDFRKLDVEGPKLCRVVTREVSAQQMAAFAAAHLTQFIAVKFKAEVAISAGCAPFAALYKRRWQVELFFDSRS